MSNNEEDNKIIFYTRINSGYSFKQCVDTISNISACITLCVKNNTIESCVSNDKGNFFCELLIDTDSLAEHITDIEGDKSHMVPVKCKDILAITDKTDKSCNISISQKVSQFKSGRLDIKTAGGKKTPASGEIIMDSSVGMLKNIPKCFSYQEGKRPQTVCTTSTMSESVKGTGELFLYEMEIGMQIVCEIPNGGGRKVTPLCESCYGKVVRGNRLPKELISCLKKVNTFNQTGCIQIDSNNEDEGLSHLRFRSQVGDYGQITYYITCENIDLD